MHRFLSVSLSVCESVRLSLDNNSYLRKYISYTLRSIGAIAVTGRAHYNVKLHFLNP